MEVAVAEELPVARIDKKTKLDVEVEKILAQLEDTSVVDFNISGIPFSAWVDCVPTILESITLRDTGAAPIKRLDMSRCGLPVQMADHLFDMVAVTKAMTTITLAECKLAPSYGAAIGKALQKASIGVTTLNLEYNNLGDEGVKKLARGLEKNFNLRTLKLGSNKIGPQGCSRLALALGEGSPEFTKEEVKVAGRKKVKTTVAMMKNRSLKELSLDGNPIGRHGVEMLCTSFAINDALKVVSLKECELEDSSGLLIAAALTKSVGLTDLSLASNGITQFSAQRIAAGLEKNTTLVFLDLENNAIGDVGVKAFQEALLKNTTLKELSRDEV